MESKLHIQNCKELYSKCGMKNHKCCRHELDCSETRRSDFGRSLEGELMVETDVLDGEFQLQIV